MMACPPVPIRGHRFSGFNIEPHFASVTEERMPDIREAAKKADAFYGLYDESFLVEKGGSIQFLAVLPIVRVGVKLYVFKK